METESVTPLRVTLICLSFLTLLRARNFRSFWKSLKPPTQVTKITATAMAAPSIQAVDSLFYKFIT